MTAASTGLAVVAAAAAAAAVGVIAATVLPDLRARRPGSPRRRPLGTVARHVAALPVRTWEPRRSRRAIVRDLPEVVETMARSVRAGSSIRGAVGAAATSASGPIAGDLAHLAMRLERGVPLVAVLDEWRLRRIDVREVALVTVALQIAADAGGSIAQALDGVADTIRSQQHLRAEISALASQAEASALLIAALPLAFAAVAGAADPDTVAFLVSTPIGIASLGTGIVLDAVALVWMRRITAGIQI